MSKYFKFLILAMLAVGLIASTAVAGTLNVNHAAVNNAITVSVETLGLARNVSSVGAGTVNDAANFAMTFTLGTSFSTGSLLNVVLYGAQFPASTITVCAQNSTPSSAANVTAGSTVLASASNNITVGLSAVGAATNATNFLAITSGNCSSGPGTNNVATLNITVAATASTGFKTAAANILASGGTLVTDAGTTANVANVINQYAYNTVTAVNNTIDYLSGAANGSQFLGAGNSANVANAVNMTVSTVGYTANTAGLTVAALLGLQDSASWQGVSKVYLVNTGTTCAYSSNVIGTSSPNGTVSLNIPAANFSATNAAGAARFDLCTETAGNVVLSPRIITGSMDINVTGTGAQDLAAQAFTTINPWLVNAYQGIIPYISTTSAYKTICMINNGDTSATANIIVDLLCSTSGTVSSVSVGTISPKTMKRVDFDTEITPYSTGTSETAGTPISLTGITDPQRYSAKLTVTANPAKVTVNCIQLDPAGSKRAVPVLTSPTALGTYWQQ